MPAFAIPFFVAPMLFGLAWICMFAKFGVDRRTLWGVAVLTALAGMMLMSAFIVGVVQTADGWTADSKQSLFPGGSTLSGVIIVAANGVFGLVACALLWVCTLVLRTPRVTENNFS